jgi:hypothetical protein
VLRADDHPRTNDQLTTPLPFLSPYIVRRSVESTAPDLTRIRTASINVCCKRARTPKAEPCPFAFLGFNMGPHRLPISIDISSSLATCKPASSSLHPCPAPTESASGPSESHSPTASTAPAASFKRPYQNCPEKNLCPSFNRTNQPAESLCPNLSARSRCRHGSYI